MDEPELGEMEEIEPHTEEWKARFELEEVPNLNLSFSTEEHLRILYLRIHELEGKIKTHDSILSCVICIGVIWALILTIIYL